MIACNSGDRVGLSPYFSCRVWAVIFKLFRADIQHVNTKYIFIFFLNIFAVSSSESVFCSKQWFGLFFILILQLWHDSDVTKEHCVLVTLFWAEIGLSILSSGLDSGCRVRAEKTRPRPTLSGDITSLLSSCRLPVQYDTLLLDREIPLRVSQGSAS